MKKRSLLYSTFGILIILGVLHYMASLFYWYWSVPYFDKFIHFLAGISLGFFGIWLWWDSGLFGKFRPSMRQAFITAFVFVLVAGVAWEFFELVYGMANPAYGETYGQDTFLDLLADMVGASIAGLVGRKQNFYIN
ncbi:hypothetical protein KW790_03265 [Candidatus Parcubacteria bacterium]|nr:hypothetical protein [Candidatus Parcubacteria bacterium]